jgi:phasin
MARTAEKTTFENVEFPTFDASKATDQFRAFAEKSVEQSKDAYTKMKSGAEETQKAIETTFETAKSVSSDLSLKTISAFRDNAEASFAHLEALVGVKSISELFELQTSFLRKRVEVGVEQAKDFQSYASKAGEKVSAPMKTVFEKAVKELKVA